MYVKLKTMRFPICFAILFTIFLFPVTSRAQEGSIDAGVYKWVNLQGTELSNPSSILFNGSTADFEWMQMTANAINEPQATVIGRVPENEERLFIIKSGTASIHFGNASYTVGPGSVAILMPSEKYTITKDETSPVTFFLLKYRSKKTSYKNERDTATASFVIDFKNVPFKPHDKGGVRSYFEKATVMGTRLEMHMTTLNGETRSHDPHTHKAEELIIMLEGNTEMQIGDTFYKGNPGDIFFAKSNMLHAIRNEGKQPCMYFAFQFE